jgi:hypothetical protein
MEALDWAAAVVAENALLMLFALAGMCGLIVVVAVFASVMVFAAVGFMMLRGRGVGGLDDDDDVDGTRDILNADWLVVSTRACAL